MLGHAPTHSWVHISTQRSTLTQHGPRAANRQGPWTEDRLSSNTIAKIISLLKWQPGCMPAAVSSGDAALGFMTGQKGSFGATKRGLNFGRYNACAVVTQLPVPHAPP
eukprot:81641-Chlamydomonas_euryale.AAC.34